MSDPTYRIEREHTPGEVFAWYVRVYRLSDDSFPVFTVQGDLPDDVVLQAQAWIAEQSVKQQTTTFYVDDEGRPVEGHSVKA